MPPRPRMPRISYPDTDERLVGADPLRGDVVRVPEPGRAGVAPASLGRTMVSPCGVLSGESFSVGRPLAGPAGRVEGEADGSGPDGTGATGLMLSGFWRVSSLVGAGTAGFVPGAARGGIQ